MQVDFSINDGEEEHTICVGTSDKHGVVLTVYIQDANSPGSRLGPGFRKESTLCFKKGEARAIASIIMGAAAEL
jgi:hypothetical protein